MLMLPLLLLLTGVALSLSTVRPSVCPFVCVPLGATFTFFIAPLWQ